MKRSFAMSLITLVMLSLSTTYTFAQQSSYDLKKASNQYNASGTLSINKNGSQYTYSTVAKDLPTPLPANGLYYILWGLRPDGKADNLGPITNSSENRGTLNSRMTQFFITSERERYPEYVSGPRILQTDTIPEGVFAGIVPSSASPSPLASSSPGATASPRASVVPVGGPTDAPETGFGGAILFNSLIYSLGGIGFTGMGLSIYNRIKKK